MGGRAGSEQVGSEQRWWPSMVRASLICMHESTVMCSLACQQLLAVRRRRLAAGGGGQRGRTSRAVPCRLQLEAGHCMAPCELLSLLQLPWRRCFGIAAVFNLHPGPQLSEVHGPIHTIAVIDWRGTAAGGEAHSFISRAR